MLVEYTDPDNVSNVMDQAVATWAQLYPNPVTDKACLQYQLCEISPVDITITDLVGRIMLQQNLPAQDAGIHLMDLDLSHLPSGVYLCRLRTDRGSETLKIVHK